jgi:non-specific serine/threonine protein kinase
LDLADDWLAQSLAAFEEMDDKSGMATIHLGQGWIACQQGDFERAKGLMHKSLAFMQATEDTIGVGNALRALADVARRQRELGTATAHLQEALRQGKKAGATLEVTWCLEDLAGVACDQALPQRAARLFGAAEALRQPTGLGIPSGSRVDVQRDLLAARASLGDAAFEAAFAAGHEMTREQAVEFALQAAPGDGRERDATARKLTPLQEEKRRYGGLTARERQVAALIGRGKSNREIAEDLVVTVRTVEAHVTHILQKLGYRSRTQVAAWAIDRGLATPPKTFEETIDDAPDILIGR